MEFDEIISQIANYVAHAEIESPTAYASAKLCLKDAIGCAILSLKFPECKKLLGPVIEGTIVPKGSRVLGTSYILDPVQAAFNFGTMIRWLDFNDTWLGSEWAHPSDNIGAILPVCDTLSQSNNLLTMKDLLTAIIKAYEIQGILALTNSFNEIGFDHVIYVKVATAAITANLMGASLTQIMNAVSNAWIDTGPLRTYRHYPNTGSRKSWAAGDQCSRGVHFARLAMLGEMGYKSALTAKKWGLFDVLFKGEPFTLNKTFGSYVIENILFKVSYPAEFHAQTAVECAFLLHDKIKDRLNEIKSIEIETQEPAVRIIDKKGKLHNPADRDHCLQYMVAIGLIKGNLSEEDYLEDASLNPLIDFLRDKMIVTENAEFTKNYYDLSKRSIGNSITIHFQDGSVAGPVSIEYPLGSRARREEALSFLQDKFKKNLESHYEEDRVRDIMGLFEEGKAEEFDNMLVSDFVDHFV